MIALTYIIFYFGILLYLAAAAEVFLFLRDRDRREIVWGTRLALVGAACLALCFVLRFATWSRLPLTTVADNLNLFAVFATGIMLFVLRHQERRGLMCFYLPPLSLIIVISGYMGWREWSAAPKELTAPLLFVHVGLAFLAYAMFFVASLTSMAYLFQNSRLKLRQTTGLFQRLPSLEQLDRTLYLLISYGYPLFIVTLWLGIFWAWYERELLGSLWWASPKIGLSLLMVVLYSLSYHARARGWLRGPKLAYLIFSGFTVLLAAYLLLEVMHLKDYNFWGSV
ncbi:MAG: cytochrome c biogenesis protein CcsA [Candidatus Hydrogenedentes bacterium]|nr:cytochrome c biogenesis protein CcsA [Candidatus Hydrogenedentota bacterium]